MGIITGCSLPDPPRAENKKESFVQILFGHYTVFSILLFSSWRLYCHNYRWRLKIFNNCIVKKDIIVPHMVSTENQLVAHLTGYWCNLFSFSCLALLCIALTSLPLPFYKWASYSLHSAATLAPQNIIFVKPLAISKFYMNFFNGIPLLPLHPCAKPNSITFKLGSLKNRTTVPNR